jgi:hypothetical protein
LRITGDRHLALLRHRGGKEGVGLLRAELRAEVVRAVEVDGVDLVEVDEVLDLDRFRLLGSHVLELVLGEDHVLLGGDLVALDDLVVRDLLAVLLGDALVPHAGVILSA